MHDLNCIAPFLLEILDIFLDAGSGTDSGHPASPSKPSGVFEGEAVVFPQDALFQKHLEREINVLLGVELGIESDISADHPEGKTINVSAKGEGPEGVKVPCVNSMSESKKGSP